MPSSHYKRITLYTTAAVGLLLTLVALLFAIEHRRTQTEMPSVLSALFAEGVLQDVDEWGAGRVVQIVIQRKPDCQLCPRGGALDTESWFTQSLRSRRSFGQQSWFAGSSRTTRASFFLNSVFSTDIKVDLRLPGGAQAFFVNPSDLGSTPRDFEARFPNNVGYFIVSHIGLNLGKTEALLYVDHICAGLCGRGTYVLMHKVNGVWHVADQHVTWTLFVTAQP